MNDDSEPLLTIGQLAKRTGVPVRTIRFWSDTGTLPPTGRTSTGYRLYGAEAVARLELIATLRELGLSLRDVRRVLTEETTVAVVAATHVKALDAQIRMLRLRRAVLTAVATRRYDPKETTLMNKLARLSARERAQIIDDFVTEISGDLNTDPHLINRLRSLTPDLPDDPSPVQVDAWVELAELVADPEFRREMRRTMERHAEGRDSADNHAEGREVPRGEPGAYLWFAKKLTWVASEAGDRGIAPASAEADELLTRLLGDADRAAVLARLLADADTRFERYRQLLAVINGKPAPESKTAAYAWVIEALRAHN